MAAKMKLLNPEVTLIALTAYSTRDNLLKAIEIGFDHYLTKPISLIKLFNCMEKTISAKTANREKDRNVGRNDNRHEHRVHVRSGRQLYH